MKKIRVMFQGGGARLIVLMAAAQALEEITANRKDLKIIQAAGVSAGAIAAAALASPASVRSVKDKLVKAGRTFLEKQDDRLSQLLHAGAGLNLSSFQIARRALGGRSLLSNKELENFLKASFDDQELSKTLALSECRLTIFTSDLAEGRSVAVDSDVDRTAKLIPTIHNSVRLPFVFSTFKTGDMSDGGVTGNLPIQHFKNGDEDESKILAFHFPRRSDPVSPEAKSNREAVAGNALAFARLLLESAMNSSVREAIRLTEDIGGVVCPLDDYGIGTLDFKHALDVASNDANYKLIVREIRDQLGGQLDNLLLVPRFTVTTASRYETSTAGRLFNSIVADFPYEKISSVQAQISGAARQRPFQEGAISDRLHIAMTFESAPANPVGIRCVAIGLPHGDSDIRQLQFKVRNVRGKPVKFFAELFRFPWENNKLHSRALVFFDAPIAPSDCPITVTASFDYAGALKELEERGYDGSSSTFIKNAPKSKTWIVVAGPGMKLDVFDMLDPRVAKDAISLGYKVDELGKDWIGGSSLNSEDSKNQFETLFDEDLYEGSEFVGWTVGSGPLESKCGFVVRKTPKTLT